VIFGNIIRSIELYNIDVLRDLECLSDKPLFSHRDGSHPLLFLRDIEVPDMLASVFRLFIDYGRVLSIPEEQYLLNFVVVLDVLQNLHCDRIDHKLVCHSFAHRTVPPWVRRLRDQSQVVLEVETLKMVAEKTPHGNVNSECRKRTTQGNFD
jgi:hypothetical protein